MRLAITSFIIRYLGWQAGIRVAWPRQRLSREMRPLAFLDPRAFVRTNLASLAKRRERA